MTTEQYARLAQLLARRLHSVDLSDPDVRSRRMHADARTQLRRYLDLARIETPREHISDIILRVRGYYLRYSQAVARLARREDIHPYRRANLIRDLQERADSSARDLCFWIRQLEEA